MTKQSSKSAFETGEDLLPFSSAEVAAAKRKALLVGGATMAVVGVSVCFASMLATWASALIFLALLASIFLIVFWIAEGFDAFKLAKPLSGEGCLRLQQLVDSHPEIAGLVEHVRKSGRQVSWGDLWRANAWLYEQGLAEQERARKRLNGVAS
ncbi:TPA: hypothetical protein L4R50_000147 [Pseudomonas aeruginosa]|nr:hypothetical protein [Pseudomonas aeruginosa]